MSDSPSYSAAELLLKIGTLQKLAVKPAPLSLPRGAIWAASLPVHDVWTA